MANENKKIRVLFIFNPKAGKNKKRKSPGEIISFFPQDKYSFFVQLTRYAGHATEIVKEMAANFDTVVCCGGDGTLNEVINGVMSLGINMPIGYIPTGSTNDLGNTLGIPGDTEKAVELIVSGSVNSYDVGKFNGEYFTYVAAFGPGTSVSYSTPQKMKNLLGYSAYMINGFVFQMIPTLKQVKPRHIVIEHDGVVLDDIFYFGAISNSLSVAGMFKYDESDVKLNDGEFELLLVRNVRQPLDAFKMLKKILERDYDGDTLMYLKTSKAVLTFDNNEDWSLDGEHRGGTNTVEFEVLKQAVSIYSPKNKLFI